jgi:hypothetical protein
MSGVCGSTFQPRSLSEVRVKVCCSSMILSEFRACTSCSCLELTILQSLLPFLSCFCHVSFELATKIQPTPITNSTKGSGQGDTDYQGCARAGDLGSRYRFRRRHQFLSVIWTPHVSHEVVPRTVSDVIASFCDPTILRYMGQNSP